MQTQKQKPGKELLVRSILTVLILGCAVRQFFNGDFQNVFICFLSLFLLGLPRFIERKLDLDLPPFLEVILMLFIFSAEILGEINAYYEKIPIWDTMLHTVNGFLMAAIGFSLVDIFNRSERFLVKLSPVFVAIVAFCFSMTIGVLWEFFEFFMDSTFAMDMQKDRFVTAIHSVALNPSGANVPIHVEVESLLVNGEDWIAKYGGYLDIGLIDTMQDLIVNFIGAVVFSVIGYVYVKRRGRGRFAPKFIPVIFHDDDRTVDSFGNPLGDAAPAPDEAPDAPPDEPKT